MLKYLPSSTLILMNKSTYPWDISRTFGEAFFFNEVGVEG